MKNARINILYFRYTIFNLNCLVKYANHYQPAIGLAQILDTGPTINYWLAACQQKAIKSNLALCIYCR